MGRQRSPSGEALPSEAENRNANAACFTMSSRSAETLSLLDEQDGYGVLSESKRASEHSYSRSIIILVVSILPILFGETGSAVRLKIWTISPTEWISYLAASVLDIPKTLLRGFFANAFKFQDSLQVEKEIRPITLVNSDMRCSCRQKHVTG
jgi:hypothetical protein